VREVQSAKSEVQKRSKAAWFSFVLRSSLFVLPAPTIEPDERLAERERVWQTHRADTIDPPTQVEFDKFWDAQHGVRSLFLMDEVAALPAPVAFKVYVRALEWGYPMGCDTPALTVLARRANLQINWSFCCRAVRECLAMITQEYRNNRSRFAPTDLARYRGAWVAFSADGCRIVASAETVAQLEEQIAAAHQTPPHVVLEWLPGPEDDSLLGAGEWA